MKKLNRDGDRERKGATGSGRNPERGSRQGLSPAWETADIFYFQKQFFIYFVKLKSRF